LLKDVGQFMVAMFRKNNVIMSDSWSGIGGLETFSYLDFEIKYLYFKNPIRDPAHRYASSYFAVYFLEDEQLQTAKRNTLSLFKVVAEIGGVIEILAVISITLIASTQNFYF